MRKHHPTNLLNEMLEGNMTLLTLFPWIEFLLDSAVYLPVSPLQKENSHQSSLQGNGELNPKHYASLFLLHWNQHRASQVTQWQRIRLPMQEMPETGVPSLSQEYPLQEEIATYSSILFFFSTPVFLPREFHWQRSLACYNSWGQKESDFTEHKHCLQFHVVLLHFLTGLNNTGQI